jgi:hypothetical protein
MTAATIKQCQARLRPSVHRIIRTVRKLILVLWSALAVSAPPAQAATCQAPPGTSAIDQYCEVVPDGTGGSSTGGAGPRTPGLADKTEAALARAGGDGRAIVELAKSTSARKVSSTGSGERRRPDTEPDDTSQSTENRNGVLQAAASSASAEAERVGGLFVVVLLLAIIAMGGWGWLRFRRASVG